MRDSYESRVFLNIPFDARYTKLQRALVFAVHDCGLTARCALEGDDGGQVRFEKILRLIESCRFGIHDLSRTTLDGRHRLPRFNMPLELGVFLGARRLEFRRMLPGVCRAEMLTISQLAFPDYREIVRAWIADTNAAGA